jgi:hypothetical protein
VLVDSPCGRSTLCLDTVEVTHRSGKGLSATVCVLHKFIRLANSLLVGLRGIKSHNRGTLDSKSALRLNRDKDGCLVVLGVELRVSVAFLWFVVGVWVVCYSVYNILTRV